MKKILSCLFLVVTHSYAMLPVKLNPKVLSRPIRHFSTKTDYINAAQTFLAYEKTFKNTEKTKEWLKLITKIRSLEETFGQTKEPLQHRAKLINATQALINFRLTREVSDNHIGMFFSLAFTSMGGLLTYISAQEAVFAVTCCMAPMTTLTTYIGFAAFMSEREKKKMFADLTQHVLEKGEQITEGPYHLPSQNIINNVLVRTNELEKILSHKEHAQSLSEELAIDLESLTDDKK